MKLLQTIGIIIIAALVGYYGGRTLFSRTYDVASQKPAAATSAAQQTPVQPVGQEVPAPTAETSAPATVLVGVVTSEAAGEQIVADDQPAGASVRIASATLSRPSWVAVRDASGRILGAARFDAGVASGVAVPLLRGTEVGSAYQAVIYVDDGDRAFDHRNDALVVNAGIPVGAVFTVTVAK